MWKKYLTWFLLVWGACMFFGVSVVAYNGIVGIRYKKFMLSHYPKDIHKIEFYSLDDSSRVEGLIKTIEDLQTIEKISGFLSEANTYFPSHPNYKRETYVVFYLNDGSKFEFIFQLMEDPDKAVYIDFVGKRGSLTLYYGNAMVKNESFLPFLESLDVLH